MKKPYVRTCVTLEASLYLRLRQFCIRNYGISRSTVISEAVEKLLDIKENNEKEVSKKAK